jgi:type IV pilus assembly protein PilW
MLMKRHLPHPSAQRDQRGLTVVELMVGFAVGLFIVGGATKLFVDYLTNNRKLLIETRLNQDLRAAADLVVRDLRRSGYWRNASAQLWVPNSTNTGGTYTPNPYRTVSVTGTGTCPSSDLGVTLTASGSQITYGYATDANDALDSAEQHGFKVESGALKMQNGLSNWQAITDVNSLTVSLNICQYDQEVALSGSCPCLTATTGTICTSSDFALGGTRYSTRPRATISTYTVTLTGTYPNDTTIKRTISETVRMRNDDTQGTCP